MGSKTWEAGTEHQDRQRWAKEDEPRKMDQGRWTEKDGQKKMDRGRQNDEDGTRKMDRGRWTEEDGLTEMNPMPFYLLLHPSANSIHSKAHVSVKNIFACIKTAYLYSQ